MKVVYVITENNGKKFWNRIGSAFENRDGSINVKFDALPVSGQCQIREYEPREGEQQSRAPRGGARNERSQQDDDDIPF